MPSTKKYELAWSNRHNCTNATGHAFKFIRDQKKIAEIRKQHPSWISPLWECMYCEKIIEST